MALKNKLNIQPSSCSVQLTTAAEEPNTPKQKMNKDKIISLSIAAGLGAGIWAMSPLITGEVEPWDAESPYSFVALLAAGAIVGAVIPRHVWAALLGVVSGQVI